MSQGNRSAGSLLPAPFPEALQLSLDTDGMRSEPTDLPWATSTPTAVTIVQKALDRYLQTENLPKSRVHSSKVALGQLAELCEQKTLEQRLEL